jgi:hypothetical protein
VTGANSGLSRAGRINVLVAHNPPCADISAKRVFALQTRAPIHLQEMMDCKVKPGNDHAVDYSRNSWARSQRHPRPISEFQNLG